MTLWNHTMRDILNKLDKILNETALNPSDPKGDYEAKKKALQDLQADPVAAEDPEISKAITQRKADLDREAKSKGIELGDSVGFSFSEEFEIGTEVVGFTEDGIVVDLDDHAIEYLESQGVRFLDGELTEGLRDPKDKPCWKGYKPVGTKKKGGKTVPNCVPTNEQAECNHTPAGKNCPVHGLKECSMEEAEYHGKNVPLGKKLPGDVKKSKVYVRKPNGNIVKVNFGDKKMRIKKSNPKRRKSFRARHNCKNPGPRWKARYWSCRSW